MNWYVAVLKKYTVFTGRARRSEYWYFFLFNMIVSVVLAVLDSVLGFGEAGAGFLRITYSIAVLLPAIGVGVRRMHDVGKSGWFLLIPIYNLVLACTNGDAGPNEYGPDPKNEEAPTSGVLDSNI